MLRSATSWLQGAFLVKKSAMRGMAYTGTPLAAAASRPRYSRPV